MLGFRQVSREAFRLPVNQPMAMMYLGVVQAFSKRWKKAPPLNFRVTGFCTRVKNEEVLQTCCLGLLTNKVLLLYCSLTKAEYASTLFHIY